MAQGSFLYLHYSTKYQIGRISCLCLRLTYCSYGPTRNRTGINRLGGGRTIQLYYGTNTRKIIAFFTGLVKVRSSSCYFCCSSFLRRCFKRIPLFLRFFFLCLALAGWLKESSVRTTSFFGLPLASC